MEHCQFAYSLNQVESGWLWSVFDENGEIVANGAQASRSAAQDAVDQAMDRGQIERLRAG